MRIDFRSPALAFAPALALGPALTCAVPRVMASLYIVSALTFFIMDWRMRGNKPTADRTLLAVFGGFIAYGLVSYFWSIAPDQAISKVGQFLLVFGPLVVISPALTRLNNDDIALIGKLLLIGLGLGITVFAFEAILRFPIYNLTHGGFSVDDDDVRQNKPTAIIVMWLLMSLPWLRGKSLHQIILGLAALTGTIYTVFEAESSSTGVILILSPILIGIIALINTRIVLKLAFTTMMVITLSMPAIAHGIYNHTPWLHAHIPNSMKARVEIWEQASRRTMERPILGWGLNSSSAMPNRNEWSQLYPRQVTPIAHLHPHNAPIQIWFELGAIGIFFVLTLLVVLYRRASTMNGAAQQHAIFITSVLFLYTLSIWGIWQTWFLATLCLFGLIGQAGTRQLGFTRHPGGQA